MSQSFSIFAPIINQTKRIMKKVLLMLVACAAMTACQQKGKTAEAMDNVDSTETMIHCAFRVKCLQPTARASATKWHWPTIPPMVSA